MTQYTSRKTLAPECIYGHVGTNNIHFKYVSRKPIIIYANDFNVRKQMERESLHEPFKY